MSMSNVGKVIPFKRKSIMHLECSKCGASVNAACNCGVKYVYLTARKRAADAVAKNPERSDRAIADEIGVSTPTVSRARRCSTVTNVTVEKRTGRDGKKRKPPKRKPKVVVMPSDPVEEACADCVTPQDQWQRSLANLASDAATLEAYWTRLFGKEWRTFTVTSDLVALARQAADAWKSIASDLTRRKGGT